MILNIYQNTAPRGLRSTSQCSTQSFGWLKFGARIIFGIASWITSYEEVVDEAHVVGVDDDVGCSFGA